MNKANVNNKDHLFKTLMISSVLIAGIISISTIYFWQNDQISQLNKKIDSLTQQIVDEKLRTDVFFSAKSVKTNIYSIQSDSKVSSPLTVMGRVPGNWSFESTFPIKLLNSNGMTVAQGTAQLIGDWMTTDLVPFSAQLQWTSSESGTGTLVLQKDNPSGIATNDDSVSIPIRF